MTSEHDDMDEDDDHGDDVEAIEVEQVMGTIEIDLPGKFALAIRTGRGFAGLVLTPELAREAAAALIEGAQAMEGK